MLIPYLRYKQEDGKYSEPQIEFSVFRPMSSSDYDAQSLLQEGFAQQPITTLFRHAERKTRSLLGT